MEQENVDNAWDQPIDHLDEEKTIVKMGMARIRGYVESIEQLLAERKCKLEQNEPKWTAGMTEDEWEEAWGEYGSDIHEIDYELAKIQRYALFVYSYSFFERILLDVASTYGFTKNLPPFSPPTRGKSIQEAKKYLIDIGAIDWPESWSTWKEIDSLRLLRNRIVHHDGSLSKNQDENPKEDFLKQWSTYLSIEGYNFELSHEFIFRVLDTFENFLNELYTKF